VEARGYNTGGLDPLAPGLGRPADPGGTASWSPLVSRGVCYRIVAAREGWAMGEKLKAAFQQWWRQREASGF